MAGLNAHLLRACSIGPSIQTKSSVSPHGNQRGQVPSRKAFGDSTMNRKRGTTGTLLNHGLLDVRVHLTQLGGWLLLILHSTKLPDDFWQAGITGGSTESHLSLSLHRANTMYGGIFKLHSAWQVYLRAPPPLIHWERDICVQKFAPYYL